MPISGKGNYRFRIFFRIRHHGYPALFQFEFRHDEETDWYEGKVSRGRAMVGYVHGYANQGWNPQVNNIWVDDKYRRKGIASAMMTAVGRYFGQTPFPGTPIEDNDAARAFWRKFMGPDDAGTAEE
jgi:GNAT superfamily N-acetyltransferase